MHMSFEELSKLDVLLRAKLDVLSREQKPQNDELVLTTSLLKFVQSLVQRELRKIDDENLWLKSTLSSQVSATPVIYKMVVNATICTNCREKHPHMTHCVHAMPDSLSDAYESQTEPEGVSLRDSEPAAGIDKFIIKA